MIIKENFTLSSSVETDIYIFTDFGGGNNQEHQRVFDWQTAIELASEGGKLGKRPQVFINDSATPLDPIKGGIELSKAFPYLGERSGETIRSIVIHVIDPEVGNSSQHPRALVLRKDGILFIGPDNGTLSAACPPDSIAKIYEIDTKLISQLTGVNLEAGGTFHGRDVFAAAAYLLESRKVTLQQIGKPYLNPALKFRYESLPDVTPPFQRVSTTRWDLKLDAVSSESLFAQAYFLAIVQPPFYVKNGQPQLFFIEHNEIDSIAIFNRKTNNLYVGPNNGLGTSFFHGFSPDDFLATCLDQRIYQEVQKSKCVGVALSLVVKQELFKKQLVTIDLLTREHDANENERVIVGRIWVDAYGNIKTTLTSDLFGRLLDAGYKNTTVSLNGITRQVIFAHSFADVPNGEAFLYLGSSGAVGPNPQRTYRYIELSSNGIQGVFGVDIFADGKKPPYNGQEILFYFNKEPAGTIPK